MRLCVGCAAEVWQIALYNPNSAAVPPEQQCLPERQNQTLTLYANLMEEVKVRIDALNQILSGQVNLPPQIVRESCFLQLRMLCELIALSALAAHEDIEATTKLKKEYAAPKIIEHLELLHPSFYPYPVKQIKGESHAFCFGGHSFRL